MLMNLQSADITLFGLVIFITLPQPSLLLAIPLPRIARLTIFSRCSKSRMEVSHKTPGWMAGQSVVACRWTRWHSRSFSHTNLIVPTDTLGENTSNRLLISLFKMDQQQDRTDGKRSRVTHQRQLLRKSAGLSVLPE